MTKITFSFVMIHSNNKPRIFTQARIILLLRCHSFLKRKRLYRTISFRQSRHTINALCWAELEQTISKYSRRRVIVSSDGQHQTYPILSKIEIAFCHSNKVSDVKMR